MTDTLTEPEGTVPKLTLKVLEARIKEIEAVTDFTSMTDTPAEGPDDELVTDLLIGIITALRCAKINTAARMSEELAALYFPGDTNFVDTRFPWMSEYR